MQERFRIECRVSNLCGELGVMTSPGRLDHRTLLTVIYLTLMRVADGLMLGEASMQHLLAHAKVKTEGRPCQTGLLPPAAHMKSRTGSRPVGGIW